MYCARAYGVKDQVESAGVGLLDEYKGHPSVRQLIVDGYGVVTFWAASPARGPRVLPSTSHAPTASSATAPSEPMDAGEPGSLSELPNATTANVPATMSIAAPPRASGSP